MAGRAASPSRATGRRLFARRPTPLVLVVGGIALVGAVSAGVVLSGIGLGGPGRPIVTLGWLGGPELVLALTLLTCAGELSAVRLRHRDAVEELTLIDPMVLIDVLLLPPREAITAGLAGLTLAYLIRRRAPIKTLFNVGTYAAAASLLIVLLRACSTHPASFDLRLVAVMLVGAAGFATVNLICVSLLFSALGAGSVPDLLRQDLRLTVFTLVTTLALSATVVTIAVHTPVFLPFAVLPAAAITYAYRAIATEEEERQRTSHVLTFSQALAANPDREHAISAFLRLARDGFAADEVLLGFSGHQAVAMSGSEDDPRPVRLDTERETLLARAGDGPALVEQPGLHGWATAVVAPLEADGARLGGVAIGRSERRPFRPRDLTALTSLASALGAALSSAQHLAELVAETSKLRAVVDQSSDGILVLDGRGSVSLWNPALERLTGWSESAALNQPLAELLTAYDLDGRPIDAFTAGRDRLSPEAPRAAVDAEIVRPDGERRSVRCAHAATFGEDGLLRDVVNVHDLTRERQVERLKSDFVATVSHELRTPITPLKGYADLLLKRGDELPPEKRAKALHVIADRAGHLARLVEDLLLASNINSDQQPAQSIQLGHADLGGLVLRAMEDFADAAPRLAAATPSSPVEVTCDSARAIQVLTNLISNALKYSPAQAGVEITVEPLDGRGMVTVRDHGRGLPDSECERIFEKFHRVEDPMVMSTGGTGLGLFIARHLARAMHGDLTVQSELGTGSAFMFWLPLVPAPAGPGEQA